MSGRAGAGGGIGRDEGAAAVEFALVLPILVLVLLGIVQFGIVFFQWLEIEHAAHEGARIASLREGDAATETVVIAAAAGLQLTSANITIEPHNPGIADFGKPVKVTVWRDVPVIAPLEGILGGSGPTFRLTAVAVERVE